jgi:hypothetical protein
MPLSDHLTAFVKKQQQQKNDPDMTKDGMKKRIRMFRDIFRRPDPGVTPMHFGSDSRNLPTLEEDHTDKYMSQEDNESLRELHADLRGWWKDDEKEVFFRRLKVFKAERGEQLRDGDVYRFWIHEWSKKADEMGIGKPRK